MQNAAIQDTAAEWWDNIVDWLGGASQTTLEVVGTVLAAFLLFFVGRVAIRKVVQGIEDGFDKGERRARKVLRKTRLGAPRQTLQKQLEDERRSMRAKTIGVVLRSALGVTITLIAVVMVLAQVGIPVTPLVASAGIVGVAFGFGAQSLVKDLLSGMFMLIEDQYGVGDNVDLGGVTGTVEEVGLRSTRIRNLDGTVWFVPNGEIARVGNMSRVWSRAMVEVRVDYRESVEDARAAMMKAAQDALLEGNVSPHVLGDPEIPGVESLAADAILLRVLVQVQPGQQWSVQRAIRWHIRRQFTERGIRLAAPDNRMFTEYNDDPSPAKSVGGKARRAKAAAKAKPKAKP